MGLENAAEAQCGIQPQPSTLKTTIHDSLDIHHGFHIHHGCAEKWGRVMKVCGSQSHPLSSGFETI